MIGSLIAFRVDSSIDIGTGHVMRCLTLADELALRGAECHFICRAHKGNLIEMVRSKGYIVHVLPSAPDPLPKPTRQGTCLMHETWLGSSQADDAARCIPTLRTLHPQWLIVDHYALDAQWEGLLRPYCAALMVIDDLADRRHQCQLLLDQTLGRSENEYRDLVPESCTLLCGPEYALLRPEFSRLRTKSLERRQPPRLEQILVTLGGIDKDNATNKVLDSLAGCELPASCQITVIMGAQAPWLSQVREFARQMPRPATVLTNVSDMALIMANSDLAIGAAGATSWERCCLALPSIQITLAENQKFIARALSKARAVLAATPETLSSQLSYLVTDQEKCVRTLGELSRAAAKITDGHGACRVASFLEKTG